MQGKAVLRFIVTLSVVISDEQYDQGEILANFSLTLINKPTLLNRYLQMESNFNISQYRLD